MQKQTKLKAGTSTSKHQKTGSRLRNIDNQIHAFQTTYMPKQNILLAANQKMMMDMVNNNKIDEIQMILAAQTSAN